MRRLRHTKGTRPTLALRLAALIPVLLVLILGVIDPAQAASSSDPAQQLADKYAPIVVVAEHPSQCAAGEAYWPNAVGTVLGRPGVVLRGPDGQAIAEPTATDLAGKDSGWYLDLPGDPLALSCDYEQWYRSIEGADRPTLYARTATDPDHPGQLALQYWFYYVYNDWNDKHEGDWEMIQIVFPAATAEQALRVAPTAVAYAQHEGSQVTAWDSPKLAKVGTHPVVYPGRGSHAAYIAQRTWFGRSAAAGFGCDTTRGPGTKLTPEVVLLPPGEPPTTGQFAWLSYQGHWGQREASVNNGPTGPASKDQWNAPITWMLEEGRPDAVAMPEVPTRALDAFCDLTSTGSLLFVTAMDHPAQVIAALVILLAVVLLLARRTRWRGSQPSRPDRERRAGQILVAAFGWTARNGLAAGVIAAVLLAITGTSLLIQQTVLPRHDPANITGAGEQPGPGHFAVLLLLLVALLVGMGWIAASLFHLVDGDARGLAPGPGHALRAGLRSKSAIAAQMLVMVTALLLAVTLVLAPLSAWIVAKYSLAPAAAATERLGLWAALRRSATVTRHRRWRTLLIQSTLILIGSSMPGVVGALLLVATGWPLWVAGLISLILFASLTTVTFSGMALHFYDLRSRTAVAGQAPNPAAAGGAARAD